MPFCAECYNHTTCHTCDTGFNWDNATSKCLCTSTVNRYINLGVCSPFPGCDVVGLSGNQPVYCITCSAPRHFIPTANNYCKCN